MNLSIICLTCIILIFIRLSPLYLEKWVRGKDKVPAGLIAGVIVGVLIILLLALLLMCWYKRRLKEKYARYLEPNPDFEVSKQGRI